MKDKIIESFKATLIEIDSITAVYNNKEASSENLQESLKAASSLLFESYSNLNIFVELVENTIYVGYKSNLLKKELSKKKQLKKVEIKIIYNQLVNILIENKNHLNLIPIKYIVFRNQYESIS
jgi:signal recognition particle GTPase